MPSHHVAGIRKPFRGFWAAFKILNRRNGRFKLFVPPSSLWRVAVTFDWQTELPAQIETATLANKHWNGNNAHLQSIRGTDVAWAVLTLTTHANVGHMLDVFVLCGFISSSTQSLRMKTITMASSCLLPAHLSIHPSVPLDCRIQFHLGLFDYLVAWLVFKSTTTT